MADIFHRRIRKALADTNLQVALDANAAKRIQVRLEAFEGLPDPEDKRQRAHAVRAEVINHLESYLTQFIGHAQENGMQVHQAVDANQAINLVLEIAQQYGARLIAKSKTMVSEEIGLNHALERKGLKVVETDLGEYIVQLRGEPPSHIITPAVHLRRQDVGKLFEEKLGMPYTEEISRMTDVARKILREVFLSADIGLSGVNFGVAETGTLCLVTNEGNGRMVTTIPTVHIALMGIERLVPTMGDLALMLSLLPRSATGQKLSVYTSLLNSPRREGDPDGPEERHLILVDNGRRAVQSSVYREILYCIRCGSCLNACPIFREIGGHAYVSKHGRGSPYPGPVGSVISPALFGQDEYGQLARASSLCGACKEACPVDIDLPKLLLRVRAGIQVRAVHQRKRPNAPYGLTIGLKLYTIAANSPGRFAIAQKFAGIMGSFWARFSHGDRWIHLPGFSGWGYSKDFPLPVGPSFRSLMLKRTSIKQEEREFIPLIRKSDVPNDEVQGNIEKGVDNRISDFARELKAVGGYFLACSRHQISEKLLEILHEHEIKQLLAWDASHLPAGVLEGLREAGIQIVHPGQVALETSSQVRAGLTGAYAGIADTGSLLLLGGRGQPLSASLLPEIHIVLLKQEDIYGDLRTLLVQEQVRKSPAGVIITGPSRTADIEMTLTIGVHGPGELYVLCFKDEG
jgi:L-lactate dehydrogenase complex protein LldF